VTTTRPAIPEGARNAPRPVLEALASKAHPAAFARFKLGYKNAPLHMEWYDVMLRERFLALLAPREHAKTEVWTVAQTAWRSIYQPGTQTMVFGATNDIAERLKARVDAAVMMADPWMVVAAKKNNTTESVYSNYSQVLVAGAGKAVRSVHPDVIIGDDVLEEEKCESRRQREKTRRWWSGTVAGMRHPGVTRRLPNGTTATMGPTKIFLVGTPFHADDLLEGMRTNPIYRFRRYAAEFHPDDLVAGTLAVEIR
jgi:hypothetical protein